MGIKLMKTTYVQWRIKGLCYIFPMIFTQHYNEAGHKIQAPCIMS